MAKVTKIKAAADPFASIARKVNEVIDANPPLVAGAGVSIVESKERRLITVTGVGGSGTFEEFTICVDGAPETRWIPTYLVRPA